MINLCRGSIFDNKCDLLIVPCNSRGGMAPSIYNKIIQNNLPLYYINVRPGNVEFFKANSSFAVSSYIGYAASVDAENNKSNISILKKIMHAIKVYCIEQSIQNINIPLLGTGAGRVSDLDSFNSICDEFNNVDNLNVNIYAFSDLIYDTLFSQFHHSTDVKIDSPRVFISYTATNFADKAWVRNLATKLRNNGVNARIDMFHLKPGYDLPNWMANEINMADKVLLICDKQYCEKSDNRKGGVGWESMIIQGDMLYRQDQIKYIAIVRDNEIDRSLPIYVKSKYALDWSDDKNLDEKFNELLLYLFDCDIEPPIGDIPKHIIEKLNSQTYALKKSQKNN